MAILGDLPTGETVAHLDTSGLQPGASAQGTSGLQHSPAAQSHLPPAGHQKHDGRDGRSLAGFCSKICSLAGLKRAAPVPLLAWQMVGWSKLTFRHGTLPKGFMDRYSLLRCWPFRSATGLSSTGRDAHLHGGPGHERSLPHRTSLINSGMHQYLC